MTIQSILAIFATTRDPKVGSIATAEKVRLKTIPAKSAELLAIVSQGATRLREGNATDSSWACYAGRLIFDVHDSGFWHWHRFV